MRAKLRKAVVILTFCCLAWTSRITFTQETVIGNESSKFTGHLVGNWEMKEVNVNGLVQSQSYGPSTFTANTWTMRTRNGTYVMELTDFKARDEAIECTLVDKARKVTFPALMKVIDEQLVIARGLQKVRTLGGEQDYVRPENLEPSSNNIVYKMEKLPANTDVDSDQKELSIHWFEGDKSEKTLVRCTIRANYGGTLKLVIGGEVAENGAKSDFIGTTITGELKKITDAEHRVSLKINTSNRVAADDGEPNVVRSESVSIEATLQIGKTTRVSCGGDRRCELTLE